MQYRYMYISNIYIRYIFEQKTPVVRKKHLVFYHYLFFIESEGSIKTHFAMCFPKTKNKPRISLMLLSNNSCDILLYLGRNF